MSFYELVWSIVLLGGLIVVAGPTFARFFKSREQERKLLAEKLDSKSKMELVGNFLERIQSQARSRREFFQLAHIDWLAEIKQYEAQWLCSLPIATQVYLEYCGTADFSEIASLDPEQFRNEFIEKFARYYARQWNLYPHEAETVILSYSILEFRNELAHADASEFEKWYALPELNEK